QVLHAPGLLRHGRDRSNQTGEHDMSLQQSDQAAAAVAKAPRVALADIEAAIGGVYYTTASKALRDAAVSEEHDAPLGLLTICIIVMRNGFTVIGKSAPASPENFNADLGRKFAY